MEAVREAERREKARQKKRENYYAKKTKMAEEMDDSKIDLSAKSRCMTSAEKKAYNKMVEGATQTSIADFVS